MADEPGLFDMYEANAARTRRRAPVREPDPLSLYASQGGVSWDKFLPSEQRAMQSAASLQAGGDYNPRDVFLGALGAVGAPAIGPAQGGATLGSGVIKPIRAYHGSPHDFERFDLSKIGTGEGAQAYGHGLYFAENPATAKSYRDMLGRGDQIEVGGKPIDKMYGDYYDQQARNWVQSATKNPGGQGSIIDDAIAKATANLEFTQGPRGGAASAESARKTLERLQNWKEQGVSVANPGRMYEVNINADPAQFLDWDKALSQQPQNVAETLKSMGLYPRQTSTGAHYDPRGSVAYDAVGGQSGMISRDASQYATDAFREAGIPGIKYLDQGSRGVPTSNGRVQALGGKFHIVDDFGTQAGPFDTLKEAQQYLKPEGHQTSNYVLFRDDIIDIVKKYGLAGAAAMYGISQDEAKAALNRDYEGDKSDRPPKPETKIGRKIYDGEE